MSNTPPYYHSQDLLNSRNWQTVGHHEQHMILPNGPFSNVYHFVSSQLFQNMSGDLASRLAINAVFAIRNQDLSLSMHANVGNLKKRFGDPVFKPKWPLQSNAQQREAVIRQLTPFVACERNGVKVPEFEMIRFFLRCNTSLCMCGMEQAIRQQTTLEIQDLLVLV